MTAAARIRNDPSRKVRTGIVRGEDPNLPLIFRRIEVGTVSFGGLA